MPQGPKKGGDRIHQETNACGDFKTTLVFVGNPTSGIRSMAFTDQLGAFGPVTLGEISPKDLSQKFPATMAPPSGDFWAKPDEKYGELLFEVPVDNGESKQQCGMETEPNQPERAVHTRIYSKRIQWPVYRVSTCDGDCTLHPL